MKVCLYAHWVAFKWNGIYYLQATHAAYLAYLSQEHKVDVICFVAESESAPTNLQRVDDVSFIALPTGYGYFASYRNFLSYARIFQREFSQQNYDLVYCRVPDPMGWLVSVYASRFKLVHHYVGDSIEATLKGRGNIWARFAKIVLYVPEYALTLIASRFLADKVFCNGPHLSSKLVKYGVEPTTVISSTIRLQDIESLAVKDKNKKVVELLYVGHVRRAKGVLTIVEAFSKLYIERGDVRLTIVGDGDDMAAVARLVDSYNLQHAVRLLGHIDDRERLKKIYLEHDLFCFASVSEGSPRVVVEAMLFGLPVVATQVGSLPYCFEDNVEIVFSSGYDSRSFYDALKRALSLAPGDLNKIAADGYAKAKSSYNLDRFLGEIFS